MSVMHSPTLKYSDVMLRKNQEMDYQQQQQQQNCHSQQNSGLLRYRSAPSSFLASLVDDSRHHCPPLSTSSEMETMFSKLISSPPSSSNNSNGWSGLEQVKQEAEEPRPLQNGYSYGNQLMYQSQSQSQSQQIQGLLPNGSVDATFGVMSSSTQSIMGVGNCSNLVRQKSSPAGFFSNECGLAALKEFGSYRGSDVSNGQATTACTSGLHGSSTLCFSSRPSCPKRMPQIAEAENEILEANSRNMVNVNGSTKCYVPSFTNEFWDGSAFGSQKSASEDEEIMFSTSNALESQDPEFRSQNLGLTHHLSLPSSSAKMESIEKFLQIQGTVPCKVRAKRGFATHPRSIAERVRRTRISERIKKLEGLFPKSDKQTSTADMLDLAVDYIKDLQEQVKILTNVRAKCKCTCNQKQ